MSASLRVAAASLALLMSTASMTRSQAPAHRVDHVGFGLGDLDEASRIVAERTGVEPAYGGEHPHLGTHNALLSLGPGLYLEVIAARDDAGEAGMASYLHGLESLSGVLWAVTSDDVETSRRLLREAGFETSEPQPGSRRTPGGDLLEWTTFGVSNVQVPGMPFLIHWADGTPHPSTTSPGGCTLASLTVTTPRAADLGRFVAALGLADVEVVSGESAGLSVELDCPAGRVRL